MVEMDFTNWSTKLVPLGVPAPSANAFHQCPFHYNVQNVIRQYQQVVEKGGIAPVVALEDLGGSQVHNTADVLEEAIWTMYNKFHEE